MSGDINEYLQEEHDLQELFSKQFQAEIRRKIVSIDEVSQRFIDTNTTSNDDKKYLKETKLADAKVQRIINIVSRHCQSNDLQVFKSFIHTLEDTKNIELAKQLSLVYDERANSIGVLNRLQKEKSLVANLKREISRLQLTLEQKEHTLLNLTDEKKSLAERLRQTERDKNDHIRKIRRELEIKIMDKDKDISIVNKELEEITTVKKDLESDVQNKSFVIDKREKELADKEEKLQEAIKESNLLRSEIDRLRDNYILVAGKEKEQLSKKIEALEDEIAAKEEKIEKLRRNQTMTRSQIEEELKKITKVQEEKIDKLMSIVTKQQEENENQKQKIDRLNDNVMRLLSAIEKNN